MREILLHGLVSSSVYALLAVGFTLVFGVARMLNLAHGSFYAIGAYLTYFLAGVLHTPLLLAAGLAVACTAAFGVIVERLVIRPHRASPLGVLMVTLALSLLVEQLLLVLFGSEVRNVPAFFDGKVTVLDVSGQRVLVVVVAVVVLTSLKLFIDHTKAGSAILAIAQDPLAAQYVGIPIDRVYTLVVAISAALAALAGVLAGPFLSVAPGMGLPALSKAFAIVIVGGLGSLPGSIMAALLLGFAETIVAYRLSTTWTEVVSLVAVLLTLFIRPAGLRAGKASAYLRAVRFSPIFAMHPPSAAVAAP